MTYRCLILFIFGPLAAISTPGHAQVKGQEQAELDSYKIVSEVCQVQRPRFPSRYAKYKDLRDASEDQREHLANVATKDAQAGVFIQASVREIDLTGNGHCDAVVVVSDPISSGGDRDVLATIYLAGPGGWQRVGAESAARTDQPAALNTVRSPADANFAFDQFAVLRRSGEARNYLIAWHSERVTNGFAGYRVMDIDPAAAVLRVIDKWTGEGAQVYAAFKQTKDTHSGSAFEPAIEAAELRAVCGETAHQTRSLAAACAGLKR